MREYWISYEVKTVWVGSGEKVPNDKKTLWEVMSLNENEIFEDALSRLQDNLYREHTCDCYQAGKVTILNVSKL